MTTARRISMVLTLMAALLAASCSSTGDTDADELTYTVTYRANGADSGTVPTDTTRYSRGDSVVVPGNTGGLERAHYYFSGWCLNHLGTGDTYTQGQTLTMDVASVTLFAKWTPNPTYTVTYDGNGNTGGAVPVDTTHYEEGVLVTVLGNSAGLAKTQDGLSQAIVGWNTRPDGGGTTYTAGETFVMGSADVTLTAVWAPAYVLPTAAAAVSLGARSAVVDGTRAYVIEGTLFRALDVSDPLNPSLLGSVAHGYTDLRVEAHVVSENVVWCIRSSSGGYGGATHVFGVDVSDPANPFVRSSLTLQNSSSLLTQASLIRAGYWFVHDYSRNLIYIIDIGDPDAPSVYGSWGVPNMVNGGPGIMMIEGDFLYLPSGENRTLRIYDLANLAAVVERGAVSLGAESFGTAVKIGAFVYVTAGANLRVVDVSDPAHPAVVGTVPANGYLKGRHGRLFALGTGSLNVYAYSLANPLNPVVESSAAVPNPAPSTYLDLGPLALPMAAWVGDYLVGMTYGSAGQYHGVRALDFRVTLPLPPIP